MTKRQGRIQEGYAIVTNEIILKNKWGTLLASNVLRRLGDLMLAESKGLTDDEENGLIALQEKINETQK
jgi:hypothetical protein